MPISTPTSIGVTPVGTASSNTQALTTTGAVPPAAKIWVLISFAIFPTSATTVTQVTDGTNTYTIDTQGMNGNFNGFAIASCDAPSGLASSATITATYSQAVVSRVVAAMYSTGVQAGVGAAYNPISQNQGGNTAWSSTSVTVNPGDILIGGSHWEDSVTCTNTQGGGNTEVHDVTATGSATTTCYQLGTGAAIAASGTWSVASAASIGCRSSAVAYKAIPDPATGDGWAGHPDLGPGFGPDPFDAVYDANITPISAGITAALGLVSEVDSLFAFGKQKMKTLGLVTEADTALAAGRSHVRTLGLVLETDVGFLLGKAKKKAIGLVLETDAPLAISRLKSRGLGIVSEVDSALALARLKSRTLGLVSETDLALPLSRLKTKLLGLVSELDIALPFQKGITVALGLVTEVDTALTLLAGKARTLGQAVETDTALSLSRSKSRLLGLVSDSEAALALGRAKTKALGLVTETAAALPLLRLHSKTLGIVVEVDAPFLVGKSKSRLLGMASEVDTALHITRTGVTPTVIRRIGPIVIGRF